MGGHRRQWIPPLLGDWRTSMMSGASSRKYTTDSCTAGKGSGYLTKDEAPDMIVDAVRGVEAGEDEWISARAAEKMIRRRRFELDKQSADLSARETEVLTLMGRGRTNQQLADMLFISEGTVKNHVSRIYEKLEI